MIAAEKSHDQELGERPSNHLRTLKEAGTRSFMWFPHLEIEPIVSSMKMMSSGSYFHLPQQRNYISLMSRFAAHPSVPTTRGLVSRMPFSRRDACISSFDEFDMPYSFTTPPAADTNSRTQNPVALYDCFDLHARETALPPPKPALKIVPCDQLIALLLFHTTASVFRFR